MTNTIKRDTGAARLPAIPKINVQDAALASWVQTVTERLEVREGRGNENERAVTLRELNFVSEPLKALAEDKVAQAGEVVVNLGGGLSATVAVEAFAKNILNSKLYQDLAKSLGDESRFNHLAKVVREVLLRDISKEARARGADIQRIEQMLQNKSGSVAMQVQELTASIARSSAGVRQLHAAWSNEARSVATNVLQLQASLGNYYNDGTEGRASLEQEMSTIASYTEGLRAQYTFKVQAGGALAGVGLAASEVNGKTETAFIISAEKFAIVSPNYDGGLMSTPRAEDVVFGVDEAGIYLQRHVYLKSDMRIDGTSKKLADGMRGSLQVAASASYWSDTTARQSIFQALGLAGSAPDSSHLVIGDMVTISHGSFADTKYWNGYAWIKPGLTLNGEMLVDGSVAARSINSNGLTIKDNRGNIILSANGMDAEWLRNLKATQVGGLGSLATKDSVNIGSSVKFPDGSTMQVGDFINRLSRINSSNIGTFMDVAAIGTAYIGNAAIGTLQIAGNSVTVPGGADGLYSAEVRLSIGHTSPYLIIGTFTQGDRRKDFSAWFLSVDGSNVTREAPRIGTLGAMSKMMVLSAGTHRFRIYAEEAEGDARCGIIVIGVVR